MIIIGTLFIILMLFYSMFSGHKEQFKVSDITGVENDQCMFHTINYLQPRTQEQKDFCKTKFDDISPAAHNNETSCLFACNMHHTDRIKNLKHMLSFVIAFFKQINVEFVLHYGGLVGYYLDKDLLPWDPDIDIAINGFDLMKIIKHPEQYQFKTVIDQFQYENDEFIVIIFGKLMDINGRIIQKSTNLYSDISYYVPDKKKGIVSLRRMLFAVPRTQDNGYMKVPYDKFYPLQYVIMPGVYGDIPVPRDIKTNIQLRYGKKIDHAYYYDETKQKYVKKDPKEWRY